VKALIKKAISSFGYELRRSGRGKMFHGSEFLDILRSSTTSSDLSDFFRYATPNAHRSYSQLFQDLFVLKTLDEKRGGYFVEFGATDGVFLSNTCLLEREYGWTGIVAEPAARWHKALKENRTCSIDLRCVWSTTGETLVFTETNDAEFSTVARFRHSDYIDRSRSKEYRVSTVSFSELLSEYNAPAEMDYLSIDTEGSEPLILNSLDFQNWSFRIITVEHNFVETSRSALYALLSSKGYKRVLSDITRWDDWYVREDRSPV
jgi:FkbM family methyltransferase